LHTNCVTGDFADISISDGGQFTKKTTDRSSSLTNLIAYNLSRKPSPEP
jgi:hypothetical protein